MASARDNPMEQAVAGHVGERVVNALDSRLRGNDGGRGNDGALRGNDGVSRGNDDAGSGNHDARHGEGVRNLDEATLGLLRDISDSLPTLLYVADLGSRELVFVNRQFERMFGLPGGEILAMGGQFTRRYLHPEDRSRWQIIMERFEGLEDGQATDIEFRVKNAEGQWRWLHCWEVVFRRDEDGRPHWILGSATDVTQRKQIEHRLRLVRLAVEQIEEVVLIVDAPSSTPQVPESLHGSFGPHIVYVNPAFERMTGCGLEAVRGRLAESLEESDIPRRAIEALREILDGGGPYRGELIAKPRAGAGEAGGPGDHGDERIVHWQATPLRDEGGQVTHWVCILRDVTADRRRRQMIRDHETELAHVARLSTMGEMAAGLAHELNQPLAAISNYVQGCIQRLRAPAPGGVDIAVIEDAMRRVAAQSERAGQVIRRLRHFVDKHEPTRSDANINDVIQDALALVEPSIKHEAAVLRLDLEADLPIARLDVIQIEQVLLNLVRNGIEAMSDIEPEQRHLTVTSRRRQDGSLLVMVSDSGKGMTNAQLAHVFDPFFTTKDNGMGMGLNISQSIVHAHQGRLWASRNDRRGMTFHLSLPVEEGIEGPRE